ncbi:MAG: hypothetical protein LIP11_05950 [Clostridiales bacterium]|nr:hypothetical protein [Clostridiales bacterium]
MFQFKNGRLYTDVMPRTLSIKIPEGFWIETYLEGISANTITLRTEDQRTIVEFSIYLDRCTNTEKEAADEFDSTPKELVDGPYPVTVGEFHGHSIYCLTELAQYVIILDAEHRNFRGTFNPEDVFDRIEVVVSVQGYRNAEDAVKALKEVVDGAEFAEFLDSIKVE